MKDGTQRNPDNLDIEIIRELETDGRQTITALAKKIGTSKATARRKLQRLIHHRDMVVVGIARPSILGYQIMATIGINSQASKVDEVSKALASCKNIHLVAISTGRYDIIIWALFKNPEDLSTFLRNELGSISGIVRSETMMNLEIKKLSFSYLSGNGIPYNE